MLKHELQERGVNALGPERTSFKMLFGLVTRQLPWRLLYTPPIPGTALEIGFIEYDPGVQEKFKSYAKPNSESNGIIGIERADVAIPHLGNSLALLKSIFPQLNQQEETQLVRLGAHTLCFSESVTDDLHVLLHAATTNAAWSASRFQIENVEVTVKEE